MDPRIITQAIKELSPESEFAFKESDLSTLEWHNAKAIRPLDADILNRCKSIIANIPIEAQAKATAKQAILDRLGLTADEAALLLG